MWASMQDIALKKTIILSAGKGRLEKNDVALCTKILKSGGLIVIPTDTVYGIVCNAFDPLAIKKVYQLKGRHYTKPLPILLSSSEQLPLVAVEILSETYRLTNVFWPGPLTLVFKTAPLALHASRGKPTIAVRVPQHAVVTDLIENMGLPVAATSANVSGKTSLKSGAAVIKKFNNKVDVIVDGGRCHWGQESSVLDATHYPFLVLREGAISRQHLYRQLSANH